ncbi:MAG: 3-oxoacyl-[acyl-carrier-protein] synthase III C-terminal domain-containing protein, partial [Saezia sp.]
MQLGKPQGYVYKRSGLIHRYHANNTESQAALGAQALEDAIFRAGIAPSSIDLLISASAISVQALPCTATHILRASVLPDGTPGFDVNLSCASFVVALQVAASLLHTTNYRRIAIVSSELASRGLNWNDEESSLIFGDGAACAIVERTEETSGIIAYRMENYFTQGDACEIRAGGTRCNPKAGMKEEDFYFKMDGRKVFKMAANHLEDFCDKLLQEARFSMDDIDWIIPHQASHLGIAHAAKILNIPKEKLINIYEHHGNQVAASIPTALHELMISGRVQKGQKVMFMATAASL